MRFFFIEKHILVVSLFLKISLEKRGRLIIKGQYGIYLMISSLILALCDQAAFPNVRPTRRLSIYTHKSGETRK